MQYYSWLRPVTCCAVRRCMWLALTGTGTFLARRVLFIDKTKSWVTLATQVMVGLLWAPDY